jgi:hypothetical protein
VPFVLLAPVAPAELRGQPQTAAPLPHVWCPNPSPQGSLPILLAAVAVRPAPLLLYLFVAGRVGENVLNHSGLDSRLVDVITLKVGGWMGAALLMDRCLLAC